MVMIGIDPHKRTHTAVAVDDDEAVLGEQLVHARAGEVGELMTWADAFGEPRTWAVESAGGLGYLLAQQTRPSTSLPRTEPAQCRSESPPASTAKASSRRRARRMCSGPWKTRSRASEEAPAMKVLQLADG
jgi:transposase